MTTRVTISTVDWPVEITYIDRPATPNDEGLSSTETVPPHSERTVYIHQNRMIEVEELPK